MQCNALKIKTSLVFFICGTITNLQIVLNTPKNPYLNQATQKNTCQNFSTPQKSRNRKFQTQNNPSIIPVTWNPEYPPGVLKRTVVLLVTFKVKVSRITSVNGTHQRKKNDSAYTRMLRTALNVSWRDHISSEDLYGSFLARWWKEEWEQLGIGLDKKPAEEEIEACDVADATRKNYERKT